MAECTIIVKRGEIFLKRWNSETQVYETKPKREQILSDALQTRIEEFSDTTFGQFFALIAKEADLYEKVFKSCMYGFPIAPYVREIAQPAKPFDIERVRIRWQAEVENDGSFSIGTDFDGYGDWPPMPGAPVQKGGIAIEYTPLCNYRDLPLKLDEELCIYSWKEEEKGKELLKCRKFFMVYDVIEAILFEITWAGDISKGREGTCPFDADVTGPA